MSSSGTSTFMIHSPSIAATCNSSVPISTGRPFKVFCGSQVVMIPVLRGANLHRLHLLAGGS